MPASRPSARAVSGRSAPGMGRAGAVRFPPAEAVEPDPASVVVERPPHVGDGLLREPIEAVPAELVALVRLRVGDLTGPPAGGEEEVDPLVPFFPVHHADQVEVGARASEPGPLSCLADLRSLFLLASVQI